MTATTSGLILAGTMSGMPATEPIIIEISFPADSAEKGRREQKVHDLSPRD